MKIVAPTFFAATLLAFSSAAFTQAGPSTAKGASANNTTATIEPVLDTANIAYANSWRITLDKQAESDGKIIFRMIRKEDASDATRISIAIVKGTTKADLAKMIEDALKSNVPTGIKVERNDKDEIAINSDEGLSITLESSNIADLAISLIQE